MTTAEALQPADLPRVQGRHQNRVLADRRRTRAVELITAGNSYQQVADLLGYANRGSVHHVVQKALSRAASQAVEEHRQLAYDRLESLLQAVWEQALAGDLAAVRTALNVVTAECKLLGLMGPVAKDHKADWPCCQGPVTLVTRPDDCRWTGCDRHGVFQDAASDLA